MSDARWVRIPVRGYLEIEVRGATDDEAIDNAIEQWEDGEFGVEDLVLDAEDYAAKVVPEPFSFAAPASPEGAE
ncbi:MAG TPA: hypothetical protein VM513_08930 [Kofleriaceae bacterium]|jgi:hypothetical protein|nr:hypothetical protein [Kofleriaceae bacterium]